MGQALNKQDSGSEGKKAKQVGEIAEKYYDEKFSKGLSKTDGTSTDFSDFYTAVCEIVEEINRSLGNTQFRVPKTEALRQAFNKHHKGEGQSLKLTKEEFEKILQDVIMGTGFTGIGAKDILLYLFGIPVTALFIKQRVIPRAIPNEIFIPGITSATVFLLAKLNKI